METQHTSVTQPTSIHSVFAIIPLESPYFPVNRHQTELSTRCYEYLLSRFCTSHFFSVIVHSIESQELVSQYPTAQLN